MTVLYIIGNGFDLWHGLPTSYKHFYEHARSTLDDMELYFNPGDIDRPWSDFETSLGTYDWRALYEEYDNTDLTSESFNFSDTYGLQDELEERANELHRSIEGCFYDWIKQIGVTSARVQITFAPKSRFINFNYTSTLQHVYSIDETSILHIHGKADSDSLVFGHGIEIVEEPELDENGDSNRTMFTDAENAAKYPLYAFKKKTDDVILENQSYFESLTGLSRFEVLGHSLSEVDLPYFRELANRNVGCRWVLYCYLDSDKERMTQQLEKCGIEKSLITTRSYPNI